MNAIADNAPITKISDLPAYDVVLSRPDGVLDIPERFRDHIAFLAALPGGEKATDWDAVRKGEKQVPVQVVVTPDLTKSRNFSGLLNRIKHYRGIQIDQQNLVFAVESIIRSIYDGAAQQQRSQAGANEENQSATIDEFDRIARLAHQEGASDIHIAIREKVATLLFRIDGEVRVIEDLRSPEFALDLGRTAVNWLADPDSRSDSFNIRERQSAVIERYYGSDRLRFRYEGSPLFPSGYNIVMRLLHIEGGATQHHMSLTDSGYTQSHARLIRTMFSKPTGMVLICGTTGSGKSTTLKNQLMTMVKERPGDVIRTVEEPPEYVIPGVYQHPVTRDKEGSAYDNPFTAQIRSAMRQDPDVIMIGEVRDLDTGILSMQATQSGHQVLSTLHASSAITAVGRLAGMGMDRDVLGSMDFISGIIYQRLLPVLCPDCSVDMKTASSNPRRYELTKQLRERIFSVIPDPKAHPPNIRFRGDGCPTCKQRSIIGRTVCAEAVIPTHTMLQMFAKGDEIAAYKYWRSTRNPDDLEDSQGKTALEHAILKMIRGQISPVDLERAFGEMDLQQTLDDDMHKGAS